MFYNKSCVKGFTLAETLITLMVVGVVAALTVPNLIISHQKEETVVRLKRAYSGMAQATVRSAADNGPLNSWTISNEKSFAETYIVPFMNVMKLPTTKGVGKWNATIYKMNGGAQTYSNTAARMYLADGTSVTFVKRNNDRMMIHIDINGDKKPNRLGRDIFYFSFYLRSTDPELQGKIVPDPNDVSLSREELLSNSQYRCHKNREGDSCAAVIMKDGWRIADDYPWRN